MDPVLVPAPPRSAYNENRRVSDLLFSQIKHFQHVEVKHGALGIPPAIARDIYTEAGAARYIAAVTRALRGTAASPASQPPTPIPGVALPAASRTIAAPGKKSAKKAASKRLPPKTYLEKK